MADEAGTEVKLGMFFIEGIVIFMSGNEAQRRHEHILATISVGMDTCTKLTVGSFEWTSIRTVPVSCLLGRYFMSRTNQPEGCPPDIHNEHLFVIFSASSSHPFDTNLKTPIPAYGPLRKCDLHVITCKHTRGSAATFGLMEVQTTGISGHGFRKSFPTKY